MCFSLYLLSRVCLRLAQMRESNPDVGYQTCPPAQCVSIEGWRTYQKVPA